MPYVNIKVTREGVSAEHKRLLIEAISPLMILITFGVILCVIGCRKFS